MHQWYTVTRAKNTNLCCFASIWDWSFFFWSFCWVNFFWKRIWLYQPELEEYIFCYSVTARKIGFLDRHTILVLLLWFNVTFSNISAIKWPDSCPVSHLLPSTQCNGQLGVFNVQRLPWHGHRDVRRRFNLLAIRGPTPVRVSRESNPDLRLRSPALYLYATAAGDRHTEQGQVFPICHFA